LTWILYFDLLLTFGELKVNVTDFATKSIDHLGLVSALCKELGIAEFIDERLPKQPTQAHVTHGQLLVSMILNGLGFVSRTLHMVPDYFADKPVERLIGIGIKANHINDDALGRCLDKLYEYGVSPLYQDLAERVVQYLGLPCNLVHLDSTSFHVDGEYQSDIDAQGIRITQGYSRDHRPDLNQVILNLITENQAGLPVYMQACSGNTNDSESFKKLVKSHINSLKAAQRSRYFIGDAALYVAETIQALEDQKQFFITRVPQKLVEAKQILKTYQSSDFVPIESGYSGIWYESNYGAVQQKWLLIKSEQASKRENHTLQKTILKSTESSMKSFKKLCQQSYACRPDALTALSKWEEAQDYVTVATPLILEQLTHLGRGRPKKGSEAIPSYQISGALCTCLQRKQSEEEKKGLFILATNDCTGSLSMLDMLMNYKSQQAVERGFRFLKSPDFLVSSLYLKNPERIEALLMIMTCCLMIYAALEHLIRRELTAKNLFFPDMKKKPTQKPTAKWVFWCFIGIHELSIAKEVRGVININSRQKIILDCLGEKYWEIYS
jgi:transposase